MSGILYPGKLSPDTTIAGCIDVFENAWPNFEETIKVLEDECANSESGMGWNKARTIGSGYRQNMRTNYDLGLSYNAEQGNPIAQKFHNQMYMLLLAASEPYQQKYGIAEPFYHENYNVLRYRGGQEYKAHYDGNTISGRCLSAIVYLNNDYEGGHVEFTNFGIKIKPEPGMLLLFPSNYAYTHIAHPVTSGTKYAIVTWMHDRPL
jgi:predicted 2-oxoglutarate/Fe(II)-dependent dioxygenase YbiX